MQTDSAPNAPGADLADAVAWLVLGAAVLVGSITMDRLENQDVDAFAVPGLLPGLLGIALLVLGSVLLLRSLRRGARLRRPSLTPDVRTALVIGLCLVFGTVLIGHGLPFWAAAALFVGVAITCLRQKPFVPKDVLAASVIGLGAGLVITLLFQGVFLVRLP